MATDPSIILSGLSYPQAVEQWQGVQGNNLKLQMGRLALQQQKQQMGQQNQLRSILSNPDAFGKDGKLTPETLNAVARIDPKTMLDLRKGEVEADEKKAQTAHANSESYTAKLKQVHDANSDAINTYDEAKAAGLDDDAAAAKAQEEWSDSVKGFAQSGEFSEAELDRMGTKFDPLTARAKALNAEQILAAGEKAKAESREDALLGVAEKREAREEKTSDEAGWTIQHDPKTNQDYRYNLKTGEATTLDLKPYSPQGAQKETSGATPRSGIGFAIKKFSEANPDASPEEITKFSAGYTAAVARSRAVGTRQGQVIFSDDEMKNAVKLSDQAYAKLPRGQFLPFNELQQVIERNTQSPEQGAAYAADNAVINTYARLVSQGGKGTDTDKRHAREVLNTAQSQERHGAVVAQLMKEGEAARAGGESAAQEVAEEPVQGSSLPRNADHPPLSMLKEGRITTFSNGQRWTIKDGQAVKL